MQEIIRIITEQGGGSIRVGILVGDAIGCCESRRKRKKTLRRSEFESKNKRSVTVNAMD